MALIAALRRTCCTALEGRLPRLARLYGNSRTRALSFLSSSSNVDHVGKRTSSPKKWQQTRGFLCSATRSSKLEAWEVLREQLQVCVQAGGRQVQVQWDDSLESTTRYSCTWLRYHCHCIQCKQAHSGQRLLNPLSLPATQEVTKAWVDDEDRALHLGFAGEPDHVTVLPLGWLWKNSYSEEHRRQRAEKRRPLVHQNGFPEISYKKLQSGNKSVLLRWMQDISDYGVSLVRDVPTELGTVAKVGELIAPVQQSIYGNVFDVVSTEKPINAAYSNVGLEFHMDLMYYESPPGLQLLHCVRFNPEVQGGESVLLDAFPVVEHLRVHHPEDFNTLVRVPATFHKIHFDREYPVCMRYQRPHIVLNPDKEVIAVNWSPPFEGPLSVPEDDVEPYYKAYRRLVQAMQDSPLKERRLEPGDCLVFNNRRMLHSRRAFTLAPGTVRHLQGCYINIDEFKNQVQVLSTLVGDGSEARRVGNHDFF
ncbi:probable gamma-butyrobetaine dioxygenase isoform X3 [Branchiostoma lanceolatum]|uniref:probable gamma-butyrobetaine dioxygenase isoform X3 n=1 Tax=Branchiostoma lanceolatum TaxID=7740 RepID=UPI0034513AE5